MDDGLPQFRVLVEAFAELVYSDLPFDPFVGACLVLPREGLIPPHSGEQEGDVVETTGKHGKMRGNSVGGSFFFQ
jgi:hypothetical protein